MSTTEHKQQYVVYKDLCPQKNQCKIYKDAKNNYNFSLNVLYHLQQYRHPNRDICKYGRECKAYKRLCGSGYRLDDRCHLAIFKHSARLRDNFIIKPKWNSFSSNYVNTHAPECPSSNKQIKLMKRTRKDLNLTSSDKYVEKEVIKNGFQRVLYPTSGKYKHLKEVVIEKLKHPRCPNNIGYDEMLSVILYTGTDVYDDIISSNRKSDYNKWKYTYTSLRSAIEKLPGHPNIVKLAYRGLNRVYFAKEFEKKCCWTFDTFTSFSWDYNVAMDFCGAEGMIFEYHGDMGSSGDMGADVSWISKFPDESELLMSIAPKFGKAVTCFGIEWSSNKKIQTVKITNDVG